MCLADVSILLSETAMFDNCVPRRQLGSCSVTRPFLSLRRVWLVRLDETVVDKTVDELGIIPKHIYVAEGRPC